VVPQSLPAQELHVAEAVCHAFHLLRQSWHALHTPPGRSESNDEEGAGRGNTLVIAMHGASGAAAGWPRWSGVSIYRPSELDALMNAGYQCFAFHRRVHWAAMLGAANLVEHHPRALWRLVSSLLARGAAGTRRDALARLPSHPNSRLEELLPHLWQPATEG
jgi:hypothetical protein